MGMATLYIFGQLAFSFKYVVVPSWLVWGKNQEYCAFC